jgi:hypothetical protein
MRKEKVVSFMALQYLLPALIMNNHVLLCLVRLINRIPNYDSYILMAGCKVVLQLPS